MSGKPKLLDELRAKIGQALPAAATPSPIPAHDISPSPEKPKSARAGEPTPRHSRKPAKQEAVSHAPSSGRGVHFYVDDADRKILNSLAVWFASQDRRMSDSQVIKAAIRLAAAQQNARLLDLADQVRAGDRRRTSKSDRKHPAE